MRLGLMSAEKMYQETKQTQFNKYSGNLIITLKRNYRHLVICLASHPMGIGGLSPGRKATWF
jgi:hypothetical protein